MTWQQCGLQTWYCPEKKSVNKFNVPASFQLLSEIGEATASILDSKVGLGFILSHLLIPSAVRPRRWSAVNAIQSYLQPFFPSLNQCRPVLSAAILSKSRSMPSSPICRHSFQVFCLNFWICDFATVRWWVSFGHRLFFFLDGFQYHICFVVLVGGILRSWLKCLHFSFIAT